MSFCRGGMGFGKCETCLLGCHGCFFSEDLCSFRKSHSQSRSPQEAELGRRVSGHYRGQVHPMATHGLSVRR